MNPVIKMTGNVVGEYVLFSKNAYGNLPLGAIPLPESKITTVTLPRTRGKSVKELTGDASDSFMNLCVIQILYCSIDIVMSSMV